MNPTENNKLWIDRLAELADDAIVVMFTREEADDILEESDRMDDQLLKIESGPTTPITDDQWKTIHDWMDSSATGRDFNDFETTVADVCRPNRPMWMEAIDVDSESKEIEGILTDGDIRILNETEYPPVAEDHVDDFYDDGDDNDI